ncbi:MAG: cysteine synthase family protein [Myxococcales bacterium]|nr:cysteine synthase family protein [Myxococcales bacterium]MCB9708593.1 cysteine synthase family protein [Myxococcales bacterium]
MRNITEAVGETPLVRLRHVGKNFPDVELYLKLEYRNPGGSVKDRSALQMMRDAVLDGRLDHQKTLIDATSGNTGVAYALFGAALGYRVKLVMPSNVSEARKDIAKAFGTELIFSDPMEGSDGAIHHCRALVDASPETYFYPDQYSNPSNPKAHYLGTGQEIIEQVGNRLTHFVTGLGTTGTFMGISRRLKEYRSSIRCVALEPDEALHGLEGLKHMETSMIPDIYDARMPDELLRIGTDAGWDMADRLAAEEGLHVGHSTGANVCGALQLAERIGRGCIVTIAPDRGDRYFAPMRWEKHYEW